MSDRNYNRVIWAVTEIKGKDDIWTRIGVSFLNKDGSENLKVNFWPIDSNTTIQLRDPKDKLVATEE